MTVCYRDRKGRLSDSIIAYSEDYKFFHHTCNKKILTLSKDFKTEKLLFIHDVQKSNNTVNRVNKKIALLKICTVYKTNKTKNIFKQKAKIMILLAPV